MAGTTCGAGFTCARLSGQKQQRWNWCGPANVTSVLTNFGVGGVSQEWVADHLGINSVGFASPLAMSNIINDHAVSDSRGLTLYQTYRSITNDNLWNTMRDWIR